MGSNYSGYKKRSFVLDKQPIKSMAVVDLWKDAVDLKS